MVDDLLFPNDLAGGGVQCDKRIAGFRGRFRGRGFRVVIAGGNVHEVGFRIIGRGTPNARAGSLFIIANHIPVPDNPARIWVKSSAGTGKGSLKFWGPSLEEMPTTTWLPTGSLTRIGDPKIAAVRLLSGRTSGHASVPSARFSRWIYPARSPKITILSVTRALSVIGLPTFAFQTSAP